ncbi:hypothetical protein EJB05_28041, partial [Eragrostis curvula]
MPPSTNTLPPVVAAGESAPKPEPELSETSHYFRTGARYSESKKMVNGSCIKSAEKFVAGGHSWHILYYPNGRLLGTTASISLYLQLDTTSAAGDDDDDEEVEVRLKFILPGGGGGLRFLSEEVTGTVNRTRNAIGFERFVTREDLEMSDCVSNDWIGIRCDVTVLGTRRRPPSSSLETAAPPPAGEQEPAVDTAPPPEPENPSLVKTKEDASSQQEQPPIDNTVPTPSEPQKPSMAATSPVAEGSSMVKSTLPVHHQVKQLIINKGMLLPGLNTDLKRLLATKEGADVDFEVGGKVYSVHRCILAARSSILKEDFYGPAKEEDTGYVRINDMCAEAFEALLHYIYTDSLPEMNMEEFAAMAENLLAAADRFIASLENTREVIETGGVELLAKTCPSVMGQLVMNVLDKREAAPRKKHSLATGTP